MRSSLSSEPGTAFATVVERDRWLWGPAGAELLDDTEMNDRLLQLPLPSSDLSEPSTASLATYAIRLAETLQERQRYDEAAAYWLAAASYLARINSSAEFDVAALSYVRCRMNAISAGAATSASTESILAAALLSSSARASETAIHCLVMLCAADEGFYDDAMLPPRAREEVAKGVIVAFPSVKRLDEEKMSHDRLRIVVREYTRRRNDLRVLADAVAVNRTLEHLRVNRERILKSFSDLEDFLAPAARPTWLRAKSSLREELGGYLNSDQEADEDAYQTLMRVTDGVIKESREIGEDALACIAAPLMLGVRATVRGHHDGTVISKRPKLSIRVGKSSVAVRNASCSFEVELMNDGSDAAEGCDLHLNQAGVLGTNVETDDLFFGRVGAGQRVVRVCELSWTTSAKVLWFPYLLEYKERLGAQKEEGTLKVVRQRDLDWETLERLPAPYSTLSIKNPSKLKGRSEPLRELNAGFRSGHSFLITGQRRVGKTSLMNVFLGQLETMPDVLPVSIDLGESGIARAAADPGRLGHDIVERIAEEFTAKFSGTLGVATPSYEEFVERFNSTFSTFLRTFERLHPSTRIALALDDFDYLPARLFTGEPGRELFLALRSAINKGTSFFFIGSERLPAIMFEQSEQLNNVRSISLDYLDHDALVDAIREPTQGYLEWDDGAFTAVELYSARNPFFAGVICSRVWDEALRAKDYYVGEREVLAAVEAVATGGGRGNFQHLWSDSSYVEPTDRAVQQTKSLFVAVAMAELQSTPIAFVERDLVLRKSQNLTVEEAERQVQDLISRGVVESSPEYPDRIRFRVPLFAAWLAKHGAEELREEPSTKARATLGSGEKRLTDEEIFAAAKGLTYREQPISPQEVHIWAQQFGDIPEQRLMLRLLDGVRRSLFTKARQYQALTQLHGMIRARAAESGVALDLGERGRPKNWYVTHADADGKSGSAMVKEYRSINSLPAPNCGSPAAVVAALALIKRPSLLICIDDIVGSGKQATAGIRENVLQQLDQTIPGWETYITLIYATLVGFERGIEYVEKSLEDRFPVLAFMKLTDSDRAFDPTNTIFDSAEDRIRAEKLAREIGSKLEKTHPLGWEDSQALVVFPDNTPNNTLPILWKATEKSIVGDRPWRALFPRG